MLTSSLAFVLALVVAIGQPFRVAAGLFTLRILVECVEDLFLWKPRGKPLDEARATQATGTRHSCSASRLGLRPFS
jgi:hypothetical protein